ncbi:MAG: hypothetical protein KY467_16075 [Gemmatimonadetes bacterium]|nr:hypothetical protein [Gemmatimonadota bacterium]
MRTPRSVLLASLGVLAIAGCGREAATPVGPGALFSDSDSLWRLDPADTTTWAGDCSTLESSEASYPTFCRDTTSSSTSSYISTAAIATTKTDTTVGEDSMQSGYGSPSTGGIEYDP